MRAYSVYGKKGRQRPGTNAPEDSAGDLLSVPEGRELSAPRIYGALAALLFTAACAWLAAALYPQTEAAAAAPESPAPEIMLRGIVLRRETALGLWEIPDGAEDGKRLSAAETGREAGLYFTQTDGFEALTPEDALPLSPERVEALLASEPGEAAPGRLVTERRVWLAALAEGENAFPAGTRCLLRLDGAEAPLPALVEDCEGSALLLRLEDAEPLYRLRFVEGTVSAG